LNKSKLRQLAPTYALDDLAFEIAFDKIGSCQLAEELDIPLAKSHVTAAKSTVERALGGLSLPVVL
jgi:hypothetical protein